jgi:hypothetical protein
MVGRLRDDRLLARRRDGVEFPALDSINVKHRFDLRRRDRLG